jgi:hypothetical protein
MGPLVRSWRAEQPYAAFFIASGTSTRPSIPGCDRAGCLPRPLDPGAVLSGHGVKRRLPGRTVWYRWRAIDDEELANGSRARRLTTAATAPAIEAIARRFIATPDHLPSRSRVL